jgi:hypothetical protein
VGRRRRAPRVIAAFVIPLAIAGVLTMTAAGGHGSAGGHRGSGGGHH